MTKELITIDTLNAVEVFGKEGGADGLLESLRKQVTSIDRDISTAKGRDNIRSLAYTIARSKTAADEAGKLLKAEHQKVVDLVDAERKKLRDGLDALKEEIRAPLTEYENKEKARVKAHEDALAEIKALSSDLPDDAPAIQERIDRLATYTDREWEEFAMRADKEMTVAGDILIKCYAAAVKLAEERAELERLRAEQAAREQKEREERIAAEAAAKAKAEAEQEAERQRVAAAEAAKAEQDRLEREKAEAQARAEKAEADRLAQEKAAAEAAVRAEQESVARAEAAAKAERDRQAAEAKALADAEAARAADTAHKAKVNNEAYDAIFSILKDYCLGGDDIEKAKESAKEIIVEIAKGKIPHVSIKY